MTDSLSTEQRSALMSRIRGVNTEPERLVRSFLHQLGFRFKLYTRNLPSKPDIVLPKYKTVIFVHGCFWHGHRYCRKGKLPRSNVQFWKEKIAYNRTRDRAARRDLKAGGWNVVVVWECQARNVEMLECALSPLIHQLQRTHGRN
jgi:DNA mismatch endonuclease, patch repair protein